MSDIRHTRTALVARILEGDGMMDGGQGMMGGGTMDMMGMGDQCPMLVSGGASEQAKDTTGGMAMTLTTTGDVGELRRRVRAMSDHMNAHSAGASAGMGMHGMTMGPTPAWA